MPSPKHNTRVLSRADLIAAVHNVLVNEKASYRIFLSTPVDYDIIINFCNRYLLDTEIIQGYELVFLHTNIDDLLTYLVLCIIALKLHERSVDIVDDLLLEESPDETISPFSNYFMSVWLPRYDRMINPKNKNEIYTFKNGVKSNINKTCGMILLNC